MAVESLILQPPKYSEMCPGLQTQPSIAAKIAAAKGINSATMKATDNILRTRRIRVKKIHGSNNNAGETITNDKISTKKAVLEIMLTPLRT